MTHAEAILRYLRAVYPEWLKSHELMSRELVWTDASGDHREWVGSEGKKRCRELRVAGSIEQRDAGKFVEYRAVGPTTFETGVDQETGEVLYRRAVYS